MLLLLRCAAVTSLGAVGKVSVGVCVCLCVRDDTFCGCLCVFVCVYQTKYVCMYLCTYVCVMIHRQRQIQRQRQKHIPSCRGSRGAHDRDVFVCVHVYMCRACMR